MIEWLDNHSDAVQALGSIGAVVVAAFAAVWAGQSAKAAAAAVEVARAAAARELVLEAMKAYLAQFALVVEKWGNVLRHANYIVVGDEIDLKQHHGRVLIGLLVVLIDAMKEADDPRADIWLDYLPALAGPLMDPVADPSVYSATAFTRGRIAHLRSLPLPQVLELEANRLRYRDLAGPGPLNVTR